MKNPKVGERVISKQGLYASGKIYNINSDRTVRVQWHYQDGTREFSEMVDPKTLKREKPIVCEKCGKPL
jgi:hypothetical protein